MEGNGTHDFLINLCLAIAAGTLLVVLARKLNLPTIVLLLLGGIGLGPEGLGIVQPDALGEMLPALVSFAVGVILFEGGLTLDLHGFGQASRVIRRLLTIGVLATWIGTAAAIHAVYDYDLRFCLFAASLVIVTKPTMIVPLLQRIHIQPRLHSILHWEGVLIDAIGVFVALLCFEWIVAGEGPQAVVHFFMRVFAGVGIGFAGGMLIDLAVRRRLVAESLVNVFVLAGAVLVFGLTELVMPEAGLMSVTIAGLVLGWRHPVELKQIKQFKAELTDLFIGTLFVVLAGRLELERFVEFGAPGVVLLSLMLFVVRPLNVVVSTVGSTLSWRERLFLCWVAPRGIVAASMASLFALELARSGSSFDGAFIETFVYSVIATTVILQGFSAGLVARLLRLRKPEATGWLVVGAHRLGCEIARFLHRTGGIEVTVVDANPRLAAEAATAGLKAVHADALDVEVLEDDERFQRVGHLIAVTDNVELNELVCQRWREMVDRDQLFRWGAGRARTPKVRAPVAGRVVWDRLPRPSVLSAEMRRGQATVTEMTFAGSGTALPDAHVLAVVRKEQIIVDPSRDVFTSRPGDCVLVIRRSGVYLVRGLMDGGVADLEHGPLESVLMQLAERAAQFEPKIAVGHLLDDLAERERAMPTFLGHGVGAPHAFVQGLTKRVVVLGRLREGLSVAGQEEPVTLLFMIASPPGDPEGHLATLADVARVSSSKETRSQLSTALNGEDVLAVVRTALE
ncbi:MAG TPA: cation:proton antiporter [Opitutaceae bacterium]